MDSQNNNRNEFLWSLLANPADNANLHTADLQQLVNEHPQSGILHALLAHASEEKNLKRASVYFSPHALFKLINSPASFANVPEENITVQKNIPANGFHELVSVTDDEAAYPDQDSDTENYFNDHSVVETEEYEHAAEHQFSTEETETAQPIIDEHHLIETEPAEIESYIEESTEDKTPAENKVIGPEEVVPSNTILTENDNSGGSEQLTDMYLDDELAIEEEAIEEHSNDVPSNTILAHHEQVADDTLAGDDKPVEAKHEDAEQTVAHIDTTEQPEQSADEDEVYDEITGIEDIHFKPTAYADSTFALEKEIEEHQPEEHNEQPAAADEAINGAQNIPTADAGQSDVSRYHDEKMPYTFMWWLDKTRKDHSGVYQPFIKPGANPSKTTVKNNADELQQQYYENIFHITSVDELDKSTTHKFAPVNIKHKEQAIIERFIKEEPQIKPQSSDKLDSENKAKKSSEDQDELITETLAAIYTDQMLYHKAIAAYQKLMLKFPEKSRYFAGKIEQLEKKTN